MVVSIIFSIYRIVANQWEASEEDNHVSDFFDVLQTLTNAKRAIHDP